VSLGASEQAKTMNAVAKSIGEMRKQSGQLSQALGEQNPSDQRYEFGFRVHLQTDDLHRPGESGAFPRGGGHLEVLGEIRSVTDRNARGVEESRRIAGELRDRGLCAGRYRRAVG